MTNIKRIMPLLFTALVLSSFVPRAAADTRAGVAAYNHGDYAMAYRELKPSAEDGDPHAQFLLGRMYYEGLGVSKDPSIAVRWFLESAQAGSPDAQTMIGLMYVAGDGIPEDDAKAVYWFGEAAEQGNALAQLYLAQMYDLGWGVNKDHSRAAYWYRKAADQGNAEAQALLADMYDEGEGVTQDDTQAFYWYTKAGEQGDARAQLNLGVMYTEGEGVFQDYSAAVYWYRQAAEQGIAEAQFNLGLMYDHGQGVPQDYEQASKWYQLAAGQGYGSAQLNLGYMYSKGQGILQDFVQAHMWYNVAAAQGNEKARGNRDKITENMTSAQIAEAQRLAREWKPATSYAEAPSDPITSSFIDKGAASPELVKEIQELLTSIGYDPGPADGVLGANTTAAIRAFQSANDLAVTGTVSDTLRDELRGLESHYAEIENAHPNVWKIIDSGRLNQWIEQQPGDVATELKRIQESGSTEEVIAMLDRFKAEATDPDRLELAASGSGFIVSEYGDVLTNHHVVEDCRAVRIAPSEVAFSMIGNDPENDLALLRGAVPTKGIASFPTTGAALRGDSVVVAGFPLPGLLSSEMGITTGNVSALSGPGGDSRLMQITAPIQPGNSGGPVLDERGQVVGVVVAEIDSVLVANTIGYIPQNVNFAIKTAVARNFLDTHEVAYQTEPPGETLKTSVIAERAEEFTVAIGCWN